jgi:hypothetical protein
MQTDSKLAIPVGWHPGRFGQISPTKPLLVTFALLMAAATLIVAANHGGAGVRTAGADSGDLGSEAAIGGSAVASPGRLAFDQSVGAQSPAKNVEVTNLGTEPLHLEEIAVVDPTQSGRTGFEIDAGSCTPGIPAMGTCTLGIEFRPHTIGVHNATLRITPAGSAQMSVALVAAATD